MEEHEDDHAAAELFSEIWFGRTWSRVAPATALAFLPTLLELGDAGFDELETEARRMSPDGLGLAGPALEPLKVWTEASLGELRAAWPGEDVACAEDGRPLSADECPGRYCAGRAAG